MPLAICAGEPRLTHVAREGAFGPALTILNGLAAAAATLVRRLNARGAGFRQHNANIFRLRAITFELRAAIRRFIDSRATGGRVNAADIASIETPCATDVSAAWTCGAVSGVVAAGCGGEHAASAAAKSKWVTFMM